MSTSRALGYIVGGVYIHMPDLHAQGCRGPCVSKRKGGAYTSTKWGVRTPVVNACGVCFTHAYVSDWPYALPSALTQFVLLLDLDLTFVLLLYADSHSCSVCFRICSR